jgi:hypothetical protein
MNNMTKTQNVYKWLIEFTLNDFRTHLKNRYCFSVHFLKSQSILFRKFIIFIYIKILLLKRFFFMNFVKLYWNSFIMKIMIVYFWICLTDRLIMCNFSLTDLMGFVLWNFEMDYWVYVKFFSKGLFFLRWLKFCTIFLLVHLIWFLFCSSLNWFIKVGFCCMI